MKLTHVAFTGLLSVVSIEHSIAASGFVPSPKSCKGIEIQMEVVNQKLRQEHNFREGEMLKQQLRDLKVKWVRCQNSGYSTD